MKQQFAAKHPWTILAAGAAIQVLTGLPAAWGVFQQPVMEEYGLSRAGGGLCVWHPHRGLRCGVRAWAASCRTGTAPAARACGAPPCSAAAFLRRACCRRAAQGRSFWRSASRRGWARRFCIRPSSPAPRSGTPAARAWPPASSAGRWA